MRRSGLSLNFAPSRTRWLQLLSCSLAVLLLTCGPALGAYFNFEAGHVRPLALSPDGSQVFAVNTPDNQLAIYDVTPSEAAAKLEAILFGR